MGRIPINIMKFPDESLYGKGKVKFQIVVVESNSWNRCHDCSLAELIKFRDEISTVIDSLALGEKLGVDTRIAEKIETANKSDEICKTCNFKSTQQCVKCLTELQSPLERKLYSKLLDEKFHFEVQYPINTYGKKASINDRDQKDLRLKYIDLLTQVDFYLPNGKNQICVYTDGHTYHERTEEQAKRDRSIDRKLQELGYVVLRFTGKEINENISMAVNQIRKVVEMKN